MNPDRNSASETVNRRKILATAASIGLTAGVAGCQSNGTGSTPTDSENETVTETEIATGTTTVTEESGTIEREGAESMTASPIAVHPQEFILDPSTFGDQWELTNSETLLDENITFYAVPEDEKATSRVNYLDARENEARIIYGVTLFESQEAAEAIRQNQYDTVSDESTEGIRSVQSPDYGDSSLIYTSENQDGSGFVGAVTVVSNVIVGFSYYPPESQDSSEWVNSIEQYIQPAVDEVPNA